MPLSPKSFSGDEDATRELEELENEYDLLARTVRLAESALPEFERMLSEARARRKEAQEQVYRARAEQIRDTIAPVEERLDRLAQEVHDALEERARLTSDLMRAEQLYDPDGANALASASVGAQGRWLKSKFGRHLRSR